MGRTNGTLGRTNGTLGTLKRVCNSKAKHQQSHTIPTRRYWVRRLRLANFVDVVLTHLQMPLCRRFTPRLAL